MAAINEGKAGESLILDGKRTVVNWIAGVFVILICGYVGSYLYLRTVYGTKFLLGGDISVILPSILSNDQPEFRSLNPDSVRFNKIYRPLTWTDEVISGKKVNFLNGWLNEFLEPK